MNRRMIAAALLALTIGTPVAAFAQSASAGLTRADVLEWAPKHYDHHRRQLTLAGRERHRPQR